VHLVGFTIEVYFCLFRHLSCIREHSRSTWTANRSTQEYKRCVQCK